jgi:hypothetical protein
MKQTQELSMNGVERVLYAASYNFALNVEKLSHEEAVQAGINKVLSKRKLGKRITCKF